MLSQEESANVGPGAPSHLWQLSNICHGVSFSNRTRGESRWMFFRINLAIFRGRIWIPILDDLALAANGCPCYI